MQSRKHSLIESVTNTAVGYGVNLLAQVVIFPLVGIRVPLKTNLLIGMLFTGISILRGYVLRRIFTSRTERNRLTAKAT